MMTERGLSVAGPRRFNLFDLMIVVVAVAFMVWGWKTAWNHPIRREITILSLYGSHQTGSHQTGFHPNLNIEKLGFEFAGIAAIVASLTLLVVRILPPRPRRVRLMRQPGWVACLAASLASVLAVIFEWSGQMIHDSRQEGFISFSVDGMLPNSRDTSWFTTVALVGGIAVLISWFFLALGGRWRGEASWIDRAGRLCGVVWLLLLAGYLARNFFP